MKACKNQFQQFLRQIFTLQKLLEYLSCYKNMMKIFRSLYTPITNLVKIFVGRKG